MIHAHHLYLSFGSRVILDDISVSVHAKDRVALVGQNGVGKSSLLKLLAGGECDGGSVEKAKGVQIGFLKQVPDLDGSLSVLETIRAAMAGHLEAIFEHQRLCEELSRVSDASTSQKLILKIDEIAQKIEQRGGFDTDYLVDSVLHRLGIKSKEQIVGTLSGGEKRRVDLARILLQAPDVYLLDEPTNHLDIKAIQFLVETLTKSHAAVLFVSHDRAFVDEVATRVAELEKAKLYFHEPPFANYLENKLVRELTEQQNVHRRERLMANELAWLRAGTPARTTKQSARIERAYELIEQVAKDNEAQRLHQLKLENAKTQRLGNTILELDRVGMAIGDRILFRNFSVKVASRQRYGIVGPNGVGKTTLLSILAAKMVPTWGKVVFGKNTKTLQLDQHREQLNPNATLKETLADHGDYVHVGEQKIHISSYLERYLFSPSDVYRHVSTLSGGEQNRLLLAKMFRHSANCLLLDEPTNDLDVSSLAVLEEMLLDYEGVVFTVSHDRSFLDRVCNAIIAFEPLDHRESCLTVYTGNYGDYFRQKINKENTAQSNSSQNKNIPQKSSPNRVKQKRSFKEEQELQKMEGLIESLEEERTRLNDQLVQTETFKENHPLLQQAVQRLHEIDQEVEKHYARWQELVDLDKR